MYALGIILDIAGDNFKQPEKQASLCTLFNNTLSSIPDMSEPLAYLTVVAMHHYLTACDTAVSWYSLILLCILEKEDNKKSTCSRK